MITYVNKVFVSNVGGALATSYGNLKKGQLIIRDVDNDKIVTSATNVNNIQIGMATGKTVSAAGYSRDEIKWSNVINKNDVKALATCGTKKESEDVVTLNFTNVNCGNFGKGGYRIIVRLTFKDLPTRFRKWTESYEYMTTTEDTTAQKLAQHIAEAIQKETKRARITVSTDIAEGESAKANVVLTAMSYDDDNTVDSINVANKVRFSANAYYTNPQAAGFASKNKYGIDGLVITKTEGFANPCSAKRVRDREAQAMGYEGIINRGCCTWPIIKPDMNTVLDNEYVGVTIEFEPTHRAADDLLRQTKQCVEIYHTGAATVSGAIETFLKAFAADKLDI